MKINNLSDMVTFFDEILYKNHDRFQKEKLNATNQLKSYIVENHIHTHKKDMSDLIVEFFHNLNKDLKKCDFKITQTQDENLYINESAHGKIFIDTSNNRFWKIHSVAKAEISDYFHQTLLKKKKSRSNLVTNTFSIRSKKIWKHLRNGDFFYRTPKKR